VVEETGSPRDPNHGRSLEVEPSPRVPGAETSAGASRVMLEVSDVAKRFGETRVLLGLDLRLRAGTVHGIIGANGAGKTTLMRVIMGETRADAGTFYLGSTSVEASRWSGVAAAGGRIAMVHQEIPVFENLRVYEHFALEQAASGGRRRAWRARARRQANDAIGELFPGSLIRPQSRVADLSLGQRQMLDIALAVTTPDLEFLVLDEPTSALDRKQAEQLRKAIDQLRDRGVAVLLVTHRLEELLSLCNEITVLRDGRVAQAGPASGFDTESLIVAMGGIAGARVAPTSVEHTPTAQDGEVVATVTPPDGRGLAVEVRRGEIVGLAGLSGSGQSELVTAIARNRRSRWISVRGRAAMVSGDRRGRGIFQVWSILRNVTVGSLGAQGHLGAVLPNWERSLYSRWKDRLQIRAARSDELVTTLSGGNQQKVLIARALAARPQVLVLDDPTRGVDASTKSEVYELLRESASEGMGILWYSTEDDEMLQCDRAYVMRDGIVEQELRRGQISREAIVTASFATGAEAESSASDARTQAQGPRSRWSRVLAPRGWSLIAVVLIALVVATGIEQPSALTPSSLPTLTSSFTPLVLAAVAEMMIISVSDIDLGIGAFMGLINAVSATWLVHHPVLGALSLVGFFLLYVLQGLLVAVRRVPAIIVTLGGSFIWLGLGLIVLPTPGGTSPNWLTSIGAASWAFPEPLIISIVVAVLGALLFFRMRLGVRIRAVGNNSDSYAIRERSNFAAVRERVTAWSIAGVFAILAGLSVTALTSSADPSASQPDTLLAIAAVIVGGGEFVGGFVEPVGAILGALMFSLLEAYLALTSINVNYTSLVEGGVLIGVLALRLLFRPRAASALDRHGGLLARYRRGRTLGAALPTGGSGPTSANDHDSKVGMR
jgi:ribose transport system ATP-binding protein